ncbi:MAG: hypothetical protein ACJZ9B_04925 [Coraliomargaritaceae bacterium]
MNKKFITILLCLSLLGVGFVLYSNARNSDAKLDVSEMEAKIKALNEDLKNLSEAYAELKSSLPIPVEEQMVQMKNKISELDNLVTDQTDLLRKIDPNGILQDTEAWIAESYGEATDLEQNGWARVRAGEILDRFNRMDEAAYNSIADVYLNGENGRMRAYALGVIKDNVTQDMKEPLMDNLKELTEDGEFKNGWLMANILEASKNLSLSEEDEATFLYIAQNHPNDKMAKDAGDVIGMEVERIKD